jgi:hypothetical protein
MTGNQVHPLTILDPLATIITAEQQRQERAERHRAELAAELLHDAREAAAGAVIQAARSHFARSIENPAGR